MKMMVKKKDEEDVTKRFWISNSHFGLSLGCGLCVFGPIFGTNKQWDD